MATQSPPSKEESTLIHFLTGQSGGKNPELPSKVQSPCLVFILGFSATSNLLDFREIEQGFSGAVKNASETAV
jgi:hypothetical protein